MVPMKKISDKHWLFYNREIFRILSMNIIDLLKLKFEKADGFSF